MSGLEAIELMLSQPQLFTHMTGRPIPQGAFEGGPPMMAQPTTVRRMIVELTAYTQIAYEKAVNDGAFDGSISNFLNQYVYKYFEGKEILLCWRQYSRVPYQTERPG